MKSKGKKTRFGDICPVRLAVCALSAMAVALAYWFRSRPGMMEKVYYTFSRPYHAFMAKLCAYIPFSVAELFYALALGFLLVYIISNVVKIIRRPQKWRQLYKAVLTLAMVCLMFWAGYSYLWTPYYYAPTFAEQSGTADGPVSVEQLKTVTEYFAKKANDSSRQVKRDENGLFTADRNSILDRATGAYSGVSERWSFLAGQEVRPKGILCSKVMSLTDFTGFFFPLTGETNVNMDSPVVMLPATAEHELCHQRGIGEEQECNFVATVACMDSGDPDFEYSGALLAYIYLGNALYSADKTQWEQVYGSLSDAVKADLKADSAYWDGYNTFVRKVSNSAYESFLQGNGQTLGLQSYGACVDLLVNYYYDTAKNL